MNEVEEKKSNSKIPVHKRNILQGVLSAFCLVVALVFISLGFDKRVNAANESYYVNYDKSYNEARNKAYNHYFQTAKEKNHVVNEVSITVSDVKQEEKLEVLYVSDVDYAISESGGNTVWAMFPSVGTFTVNLKPAEFIIDNEQKYVLARVPKPELSDFSIDRQNVKILLTDNGIFNGSYKDGESMAQRDYEKAYREMKDKMLANGEYIQQAEDSAEFIIKNLITAANSEVDGLTVDVEFFE